MKESPFSPQAEADKDVPAARPSGLQRILHWRWLLAFAGVGIGLWAERMTEEARAAGITDPAQIVWIMFGAAAVLVTLGLLPTASLPPAEPVAFKQRLAANPRRRIFLVLLALAVLCSIVSIPLFVRLNTQPDPALNGFVVNTGSWLLYIASLFLFGGAWVLWERTTPGDAQGAPSPVPGGLLPRRVEWVVVAALFFVALAIRTVNLESVPTGLWFDEAQNGIVGRDLLAAGAPHPTFLAEHTQMGTLYFYFQGLLIGLLGNVVAALRLIPALSGALLVPMIYGLASRLFGWRVGLAAAGFLAVSVWNITFSRLGLVSMSTVALDVGVYLCMVQALRTGRLGYFAGAGVLLGFGLQGYYVSRLVPVLLVAVLIHRLITERMRILRSLRAGFLIFIVATLLSFVPVATFAVLNPGVYNGRISTVSIFSPEGSGGNPNAFSMSLSRHLLMFNYHGDNNGRHNLPDQPMLDWLTAALFFVGLGSCILRARRWQYAFPVLWFAGALSGGVLSLIFEAPQGHRTLEESVVTSLIAGIVLGETWAALSRFIAPESAGNVRSRLTGFYARRKEKRVPAKSVLPERKESAPVAAGTLPVRVGGAKTSPAAAATPATSYVAAPEGYAPDPALMRRQGAPQPVVPEPQQIEPDPVLEVPPAPQPKQEAKRRHGPFTTRRAALAAVLSFAGIIATVAFSGYMNLDRYFRVQANDRGVWASMYSAENAAAMLVRNEVNTHDVYVTPLFIGLPPSLYLAPGATPLEWLGMHKLPLRDNGHDVVIALDTPAAADIAAVARIYHNATFEPLAAPSDPTPLMWTIRIPASDLSTVYGVEATLFDAKGAKQGERLLQTFELDNADNTLKAAAVRLRSTIKVETFGNYKFDWQDAQGTSQAGKVTVDGYPAGPEKSLELTSGLHSIVVTDTVRPSAGRMRLTWQPVGSGAALATISPAILFDPRKVVPHGLTGLFRAGDNFTEPPKEGRIDPVLSMYFHHTPLPRPYTGDWRGQLYCPVAGDYRFTTEQLSKSRLLIDGQQIIANANSNSAMEYTLPLTKGFHKVQLLFEDLDNYSHLYLYWTPPGMERSIIPSAMLWPEMASYPDPAEGGDFPTLDEADGSKVPPDRIISKPNAKGQNSDQPSGTATDSGKQAPQAGVQTPAPGQQPASAPPASSPATGDRLKPVFVAGDSIRLKGPLAAAADSSGDTYVFTEGDSLIHKYDPAGKEIKSWPVKSLKGDAVTEVSAMLVRDKSLVLLDAAASDLLTFDLDGQSTGRKHLCECYFPRGLAIAPNGNYWLADTGNDRVALITEDGRPIKEVKVHGSGPGEFIEPTSVWEPPNKDAIYVMDTSNGRIQKLSPDLKPLASWNVGKSIARDGNRLTGDGAGNVIASVAEAHAVIKYDPNGKELARWLLDRAGPLVPSFVTWTGDDKLVVVYHSDNVAAVFDLKGK